MQQKLTVDGLSRKLKNWEADMDRFEKNVQRLTADLQRRVDELKGRRNHARKRTGALLHNSSEAWTELKDGAEEAMRDLRKAVKRARSRFR